MSSKTRRIEASTPADTHGFPSTIGRWARCRSDGTTWSGPRRSSRGACTGRRRSRLERSGEDVFLKAELLQRTGSFKPRGVLTKLASLTPEEKARGVIGISAGNHAQAVAWGAAEEGLDALLVMWAGASETKIAATRGYGASVDLEASGPGEAFERLDVLLEETGRTLVHPFDDPLTIAGQGTVGLELLEDVPGVDTIVVPIGGGGLISGVAVAAAGRARVIGVEPELSTAMHSALGAGERVDVTPTSIADGLNAPHAGEEHARDRPGARGGGRPRHRGRDRSRLPLPLRAGEAGLRAGRRSGCRGGARGQDRGRSDGVRRLGRERRRGDRRCYSGQPMKAGIHPDYVLAHVTCSCGNEFWTRSTKPELHVEICAECHPFYTGKQKLVDTGGRVERFQRRLEKAGGSRRG